MIDWKHISLKDLAAFLSEELRKREINAILVGGACVTIYWNDRQGLEQAINICLEISIDLDEIEKWSIHENHKAKFDDFLQKLRSRKNSSLQ